MALAPARKPIGLFKQFFAQGPQTIVLQEKVMSLTGDSFDIKLVDGTPILKVKGKVMSISGRKDVYDMADKHVFSIVKEHFHLHTTFAVENPAKEKLLEVKSGFALIGSKAKATFISTDGTETILVMKGGFFETSADIIDDSDGQPVAHIDRKLLSGKDIFFGQQTYAVQVAPDVDIAMIAALCICLDEKNEQKKK